jgi:2-beta-glucuronyltransferase
MKRAVILTGHFPFQKRGGSILWVSEHLQKMGWHVTHATVGYSWLSLLKPDPRIAALGYTPKHGARIVTNTLTTIYSLSPIHPLRTKFPMINKFLDAYSGLFKSHWDRKLRGPLTNADLVICESGAPILLAPLLTKYAPNAARIYRVNDNIRLLNAPNVLIKAEHKNQSHFTRISSANLGLIRPFEHHNKTIDPMGIPLDRISKSRPSPYTFTKDKKIAVCAGTTQLDGHALAKIAQQRPNWQIHILGRIKPNQVPTAPNIMYHGEQEFDTLLAYVQHADIGLAPYIDSKGIEYQTTNSNRMLLYRHHGLPILGPDRLCDRNMPSIIGYSDPNALDRCEAMQRQPEAINDWSTLAIALSQNPEIVPPTVTS